jgi:hypothetical protein
MSISKHVSRNVMFVKLARQPEQPEQIFVSSAVPATPASRNAVPAESASQRRYIKTCAKNHWFIP